MNAQLDIMEPERQPLGIVPPGLDQVTVFGNFAAASASWLALEERAVFTPYQRLAWMQAMYDNGLERGRLAIAVLGAPEQPAALLPLVIRQRGGLVQASLVGSHFANSDWLMFDPAIHPGLSLPVLQHFFAEIIKQAGRIDIVRLSQMPAQWDGHTNPLLGFRHQSAPNNLYVAEIGAVPRPFIDHGMTSKLRSNLRRGRARLEEQFGPISVRRIVEAAELERVHATFLAQRGRRFAEMGVDNIFATPGMVEFFKELATTGLGQHRPALLAHALYAGEDILATSFGTMAHGHFSQYINSTSAGPAGKYSLMGILMAAMMDDLTASGISSFDMGTGDFAYKSDWSQPEAVFDSVIAVSRRGALALPMLDALVRAKRAIKQNPRAWALAMRMKKARYDLAAKLRR